MFVVEVYVRFLVIAESRVLLNQFKGSTAYLLLSLDEFGGSQVGWYPAWAGEPELFHYCFAMSMKFKNVSHGREMTTNHSGAGQFFDGVSVLKFFQRRSIQGQTLIP
jgi:hypothetical protein